MVVCTQQAHNVATTSIQRLLNVKALIQRWNDVVSTLCARWVPTMTQIVTVLAW